MDMEELGYFIFMEGQEEKAKQENEEREALRLPFSLFSQKTNFRWVKIIFQCGLI